MTLRQVFDLPQPQPLVVTEHRAMIANAPPASPEQRAVPDGVNAPSRPGQQRERNLIARFLTGFM
jgi:hypothetical protein